MTFLIFVAALAVAAIAATLTTTARDGYRHQPTRRA
tara:strand:- start:50840 stop:50947 length:108 start_codon:yes stop_codon:yes gene_type:complete